jgi:hypothetical protein
MINEQFKTAVDAGLIVIDERTETASLTEDGWDSLLAMLAILAVTPVGDVSRQAQLLGNTLHAKATEHQSRRN